MYQYVYIYLCVTFTCSESAHGLPLFDIRQQKLLELSQKEAALLTEILIPRLPADSPGNNTRCLTSLLANNLQPAKTAFIRKKIDALNKKGLLILKFAKDFSIFLCMICFIIQN